MHTFSSSLSNLNRPITFGTISVTSKYMPANTAKNKSKWLYYERYLQYMYWRLDIFCHALDLDLNTISGDIRSLSYMYYIHYLFCCILKSTEHHLHIFQMLIAIDVLNSLPLVTRTNTESST